MEKVKIYEKRRADKFIEVRINHGVLYSATPNGLELKILNCRYVTHKGSGSDKTMADVVNHYAKAFQRSHT